MYSSFKTKMRSVFLRKIYVKLHLLSWLKTNSPILAYIRFGLLKISSLVICFLRVGGFWVAL